MKARIASVAAGVGFVVPFAGAGIAAADPPRGDIFPLDCDNGSTYQVIVTGNGEFTPAHNLANTSMLIPTAFGEFHATLSDSEGNVIEEETQPPAIKGNSGNHQRATTATCTFTLTDSFEDPALGTLTFTVEGSVTGFVTPAG